ncbi:MAG: hypothetical protein VB092_04970 [Oscillospiraceae bacterium]|nr:hypothetical protein [Oscillospiraceae bacterium]
MKTVALIMKRRAVAQLLTERLAEEEVCARGVFDYARAAQAVLSADAALIEAGEDGAYTADACLALCAKLHAAAPGCRLLLLCPEGDAAGVRLAAQAARDGTIQDFVFYNASTEYLVSKILAL